MNPIILEEKSHSNHKKIVIVLSIIVIVFSIAFDLVYLFYYQNSEVGKVSDMSGLSKEEIVKRENLQEISRINSQNPVSNSTKQSLLNDLNKLNKKAVVTK